MSQTTESRAASSPTAAWSVGDDEVLEHVPGDVGVAGDGEDEVVHGPSSGGPPGERVGGQDDRRRLRRSARRVLVVRLAGEQLLAERSAGCSSRTTRAPARATTGP